MRPLTLLLLFSLAHPIISLALFVFDVFDAMLGLKGAPVGTVYDVFSLAFFVLNLPGAVLSLWWWSESSFYAPVWRMVSCFTMIFLSWACWTAIGYGLMKAMRPWVVKALRNKTMNEPALSIDSGS